ncbi:MAG: PD40 domain-containing protein [Phycisphaerae bacterium]|nr:PD40 domain-containing protein [Phycisphaerae bacterium]
MRFSANHLRAVVCVCAFVASAACGDATTWINPKGGAWSDPANWSNGVPDVDDHAIFIAVGPAPYAVSLPPSAVAGSLIVAGGDVPTALTFSGGALSVAGTVSVATGAGSAGLVFENANIAASAFVVGSGGGVGAITVDEGSTANVGAVLSGFNGNALLTVEGQLTANIMDLGSGTTLRVWCRGAIPAPIVTGSMDRDGTLELVVATDVDVPTPQLFAIESGDMLTGAFDRIVTPTIAEYTPLLELDDDSVSVMPLDPLVRLDVSVGIAPAFVGFAHPISFVATYSSGTIDEGFASDAPLAMQFATSDASVAIIGGAELVILDESPFTLIASHPNFGVPIEGTATVAAIQAESIPFWRVATTADSAPPNGPTWILGGGRAMTSDGRYALFVAGATNIVEVPDGERFPSLFRTDLETGDVVPIDINTPTVVFAGASIDGSISDDGSRVAFLARPANEGEWGQPHAWVRDLSTGQTSLVSHDAGGALADGAVQLPSISGDGSVIYFASNAENLLPAPLDDSALHPPTQIYRYLVSTGAVSLVTVGMDGKPANGGCDSQSVSHDGNIVAFESHATNLIEDNSGGQRIIIWNAEQGTFVRADVSTAGVGASSVSSAPFLTSNGRLLAFESYGEGLGAPPDGNRSDVFLRDLLVGTTEWMSPPVDGASSYDHWRSPRVSDDGRFVAFVGGEYVGSGIGERLRRVDRVSGAIDEISLSPWGLPRPVAYFTPAFTADGSRIVFTADDKNLVVAGPDFKLTALARNLQVPQIADLNSDGAVDAMDLAILIAAWGGATPGDLNLDGTVNAADLAILLGAWTPKP